MGILGRLKKTHIMMTKELTLGPASFEISRHKSQKLPYLLYFLYSEEFGEEYVLEKLKNTSLV